MKIAILQAPFATTAVSVVGAPWLVLQILATTTGNGNNNAQPQLEPLEWWQGSVIYQIYPASFQDSDGDGLGDLRGILSRVDYLTELGIGAVWLNPFYRSPMVDFGYDISNFTEIDPSFGTMADFRQLVTALHAEGIKVILDFIPNHSSDQHPWFQRSVAREEPYTDYYTWRDQHTGADGGPPNNWVSMFGGSMWEWNEVRSQYYLHQYAKEQPDLRLDNPRVVRALHEVMEFWLELGVDGFRMDAVTRLFENQDFPNEAPNPVAPPATPVDTYAYWEHRHSFNLPGVLPCLAGFRKLLDDWTRKDGHPRVMLTEGYIHSLPELMKYYRTPEQPVAHFPFNFKLAGLPSAGATPGDTARALKQEIDGWVTAMPVGTHSWPNWLVGNHDKPRVGDVSRFGPHLVDVVNMIVLLLPGTAVTYYGEELGMLSNRNISYADTKDVRGRNAGPDRYKERSRDPQRSPMQWSSSSPESGFSNAANATKPWLPVHPNYQTGVNVEEQRKVVESHLKVYKALVALRQTEEWKYGGLETRVLGGGGTRREVFGFTRHHIGRGRDRDRGLLVLANLGSAQVKVDATAFKGLPTSHARVLVKSVGVGSSVRSGTTTIPLDSVRLEPNQGLVLRYDYEVESSGSLHDEF